MIYVTFPDGAKRAFEPGVSGLHIAKSISPSLAKRTVAALRDGEIVDLADPIPEDARLEFPSATTRAPSGSSGTTRRMSWRRRCSRVGRMRR